MLMGGMRRILCKLHGYNGYTVMGKENEGKKEGERREEEDRKYLVQVSMDGWIDGWLTESTI